MSHFSTVQEWEPVDVIIGLLLYASTLFLFSNALLLGVLLLLAWRKDDLRLRPEQLLVVGFSCLALINIVFHLGGFDSSLHASSPAVIIVALSAALAPAIRKSSLRIFVIATCLEVIIGCFEFANGSVALTPAQAGLAGQELSLDSMLLYDLRVFGLSGNSSLLAEKVFIATILTAAIRDLFHRKWIPLLLLFTGLYISFNRTAILCTIVFLVLYTASKRFRFREFILVVVVVVAALFLLVVNWDAILFQLTRGSGVEMSHSELSRLYFWEHSLDVIKENPLFGNGSLTFRIEDPVTGSPQHAHNSFLMLFATHGVIASFLLLVYVVLRIDRTNWRMVAAFFVFSLTQYFVFWNLSVPDLVLFWILGQSRTPPRPLSLIPHLITDPNTKCTHS